MIQLVKCHSKKINYRCLFLALLVLTPCTLILWFEEISNHYNVSILRQLPQNEASDMLPKFELPKFEHLQSGPDMNIQTVTTLTIREEQYKHELQISGQKKVI